MAGTEFSERQRRLGAAIEILHLDAVAVSHLPNVRYLTGFTGSNGLVVLLPGETILLTDPRYAIQARQETASKVVVCRKPLFEELVRTVQRRKASRLGFEKAQVTYGGYDTLRAQLGLGVSLEPVGGLVERERMLKSPAEVARIRQSVRVNSEAFTTALRHIRIGMAESDLSAEIDYRMRLLGAEKPAFETIVASGPRSALPHARASRRPLRRGELVLIDMGACLDGYSSDMTRMLFMGRAGRKIRRLYKAVLEAQLAAIAGVRPGVKASAVDRGARQVLSKYGLAKAFVHSTGHGLGLEIHEAPRLGKKEQIRLEPGMVVTIEPGVYIEGLGGIRIEDTVVVTEHGCDVLTPTPKELLEL